MGVNTEGFTSQQGSGGCFACHWLKKEVTQLFFFNNRLSFSSTISLICAIFFLGKCIKVQRKQALVTGSDSSNKLSPSNKRSLVQNPVAHRPLRDRIIHLLALKPYRKPELLLWLERERAGPKDKADLASVLDEVRLWTNRQIKCTSIAV